MKKKCKHCNRTFIPEARIRGFRKVYCSAPCRDLAYQSRRRKTSGGKEYQIKYFYGLTHAAYKAIWLSQGKKCAICRTALVLYSPSTQVDHDHTCCDTQRTCGQCVRGLLCPRCNTLLGMANDNLLILRQAIAFLTRY